MIIRMENWVLFSIISYYFNHIYFCIGSAHEMSESHRKATLMELATTAIPGSSVAKRSLLSIHESVLKQLKILFITYHGLAMNAHPFREFTYQCDMDRAKGLDIRNTYITVKAAEQFTHFISEVIRNEIAVDLNKTPY